MEISKCENCKHLSVYYHGQEAGEMFSYFCWLRCCDAKNVKQDECDKEEKSK